jgi:hypothetical protein
MPLFNRFRRRTEIIYKIKDKLLPKIDLLRVITFLVDLGEDRHVSYAFCKFSFLYDSINVKLPLFELDLLNYEVR